MKLKRILAMLLCATMVLSTMGTVAFAEETTAVAKIGEQGYETLAKAAEAATAGDTVEVIADYTLTAEEAGEEGLTFNNVNLTVAEGVTLTVEGTLIIAGGSLTDMSIEGSGTTKFNGTVNFYGDNSVVSGIGGSPFELIVNESATLLISRFVLGYDRNITVYGNIEGAHTFDPTGKTPSLKFNSTSGVSVGGTGTGNITAKDAYVEFDSSSWKNSQATHTWNFENCYVSATSFGNNNAPGSEDASWTVTFNDSVLNAKNYIKTGPDVTYSFTNGSVATTGSLRNDGVINIDETSSVTTTSQQNNKVDEVDEHGGNNGTINVSGALTVGSNAKTAFEMLGGTLNVDGGSINLGNNTLTLDATSKLTSSGDISGEITVVDGAEVVISDGTYTQDVSDWCADGFSCEKNDDGTFGIVKAPVSVTTLEELKEALADGGKITVTDDITVDEALTIPECVEVIVDEGKTLRVLDTLTNNGTISGDGSVSVDVMVYVVETVNPYDDVSYNKTATKNGAIGGNQPICDVTYEISLDNGVTWFADTTNGKAQAVTVKTDGTKAVNASFQSAFTSATTGETVHMLKDVHVQSTNPKKNNGPLRSYYGLILEGNGHTIYTDVEPSGASNEYATIKFTSYLAGTGPEVNPVLKNVTVDSQKNAKADLDFVSGDVTFTVTMYNVNLLGNCQYASFAMTSPSFIINKSVTEIYDCAIPSWDAGSAKAIDLYSGEYSLTLNSKCTVYGGTYTKDVSAYLADGVLLEKNADGKYIVTPDPAYGKIAQIGDTYYETLEEAFAEANEGDTIRLMADATPVLTSQRAITKASVIDLGGKTLTLTEDDLYFGTTTFKNGNIVVDPSVKPSTAVFWMFADQTLTFDNVKLTASGVTGTYLIGLDGNNSDLNLLNGAEIIVNNDTALDLDIICVNASTGNDIVIDNSKVSVTNLDGRVFFRGNYTISGNSDIDLEGITKAGFRIEAGQTLDIRDTATVDVIGEPRDGGIHLTDVSAIYKKADTATVNATIKRPVAKIGDVNYSTIEEAFKAATDGCTITLFDDITISDAWDCRYNGAKFTIPVTIDGNGKTLKLTGAVDDKNWNTVFRFEADATVKNLTIDASEATGIQRGITSKSNITVDNCTLIGNGTTAKRAVIFGEGAGDGISNVTATITKSHFINWSYGVSDNQSGKDAKAVSITDNTFSNASVLVSAAEEVTFTGNTVTDGYVNISSYTAADTIIVTATGNTIVGTDDEIMVNPDNITADEAFITPVAKIGSKYYETLSKAITRADNGDTITLLTDTELGEMLVNTKKITLNLNGKTITGTDNTDKNFSLIDNRGELTIKGDGKMTLTATVNSGWNRYSAVIANNPGGKLVVENGTLEHLGGTDMAYGIDNLTNGKGTYAETIINGGTVKSTYRGIRQFLNGVEAQNILTVNGGTIEGANKSIWMQDPNKNANSGALAVAEDAVLKGDVYLFVTEGSAEWPVEVSIAASAVNGKVIPANVPSGYEVALNNDYYVVSKVNEDRVAEISGVRYTTLQEAIDDAQEGDTIILLKNITSGTDVKVDSGKNFTLDLNGYICSDNIIIKNAIVVFAGNGRVNSNITGDITAKGGAFYGKISGTVTATGGSFTEETNVKPATLEYQVVTIGGRKVVIDANIIPTDKITVKFEAATNEDGKKIPGVFNIVLYPETDKIINEFVSAELTFVNASKTVSQADMLYTITGTEEITAERELKNANDADALIQKWEFNVNNIDNHNKNGVAKKIVLGTITFDGYGTLDLTISEGVVHTTMIATNNEYHYVVADKMTDKDGELVIDEANIDAADATITENKRVVKVNVNFVNDITAGVDTAYNDMYVSISGEHPGYLGETKPLNVTSKNEGFAEFTLTAGYRYTITVKGAGYRTARYTTIVDEKSADENGVVPALELNFWNNVKSGSSDPFAEIEAGVSGLSAKNFLAGDIAMDNIIDKYDIAAAVSYFGTYELDANNKPGYAKYDLNRDGKIDSEDIAYVLYSVGE